MTPGLKLSLEKVLALVVLVGGAGYSYFRFIEPRLQARRFADLSRYAELTAAGEPLVADRDLYRIGRVLVLYPARVAPTAANAGSARKGPARIHPAWHRLDRELRASKPTEVGTVIHLLNYQGAPPAAAGPDSPESEPTGPAGIEMVVFDWHKRRWIGRHLFFETVVGAGVPTQVIVDYIEGMPAR